jgi:hypothetical protein
VIDDGGALPGAERIADHQGNPEFAGWVWALLPIDLSMPSDKAERVNVRLPASVMRRVDASAKAVAETRSGFIIRRVLAWCRRAAHETPMLPRPKAGKIPL